VPSARKRVSITSSTWSTWPGAKGGYDVSSLSSLSSFSLLLSPSLSFSLLLLSLPLHLSPYLSLYPYLSFSLSSLPLPRPSPPRPLSHCLPRPRSDDKAAATHALCSYVTSNMCLPHTPRACTQGRETRGRHRGCVHFACLHQAQDSLMPRVPRAGHIQGSLRHRLSEEWRVKHQRESKGRAERRQPWPARCAELPGRYSLPGIVSLHIAVSNNNETT